jgi:hypothetical protein
MDSINDVLFYVLIMLILPMLEAGTASRSLFCQVDFTQWAVSKIIIQNTFIQSRPNVSRACEINDTKYDPFNVKSRTIWAIEAVGLMPVIM